MHGCHLHPTAAGLSVPGRGDGLGEPHGAGLALVQSRYEASFCVAALREALEGYGPPEIFNSRPGESIHQRRLHRRAHGGWRAHLDGRQGPLDGQRCLSSACGDRSSTSAFTLSEFTTGPDPVSWTHFEQADTMSTMAETKQARFGNAGSLMTTSRRQCGAARCSMRARRSGGSLRELDLTESALRVWVERARADRTQGRTGLTTELNARSCGGCAKRHPRAADRSGEILKKAAAFFAKHQVVKFACDRCRLKATFPVVQLCRTLDVSLSGFYAWQVRPASAHARRDQPSCGC